MDRAEAVGGGQHVSAIGSVHLRPVLGVAVEQSTGERGVGERVGQPVARGAAQRPGQHGPGVGEEGVAKVEHAQPPVLAAAGVAGVDVVGLQADRHPGAEEPLHRLLEPAHPGQGRPSFVPGQVLWVVARQQPPPMVGVDRPRLDAPAGGQPRERGEQLPLEGLARVADLVEGVPSSRACPACSPVPRTAPGERHLIHPRPEPHLAFDQRPGAPQAPGRQHLVHPAGRGRKEARGAPTAHEVGHARQG